MKVKHLTIIVLAILSVLFVYLLASSKRVSFEEVNCFDYYLFGESFILDAIPEKQSYGAGENVTFYYKIFNPMEIPLTHASLRVQIAYKGNAWDRPEGDDIIDEFFAVKNLNLKPKDVYEGEFEWQVPAGIKSGIYVANLYLIAEDKFNLAGISFLSNVVGYSVEFSVRGENSMVRLNRSKIEINGNPYLFRAAKQTFSSEDQINIKAEIVNEGPPKNVEINYQVYKYDDLKESDEIKEFGRKEKLYLPSDSKSSIVFSLNNLEPEAYLVKVSATSEQQKSIVKLRVPVVGDKGRFIYLALVDFPVKAGKSKVFFCLTNGASPPGEEKGFNGRVNLEITDKNGNVIAKASKDVEIRGKVDGYLFTFDSPRDYRYVNLKATITDSSNKVHDSLSISYDYTKFFNISRNLDLALPSSVAKGNEIKYRISFTDEFGDALSGKVLSYVSDSSGKVVLTIPEKNIQGSLEDKIPSTNLEKGKYKLTVTETTYQKSVSKEFSII
jgi:hypothetical protein